MPRNQISIRRIDEEKSSSSFFLPKILDIESEVNPSPWSKAQLAAEFEHDNSSIYGLFNNGVLFGFAIVRIVTKEMELFEIAIRKGYQHQGFGQQLLTYIISSLPSDIEKLYLEVRKENATAMALYRKIGFVQTGIRRDYYSNPVDDAILMTKDLT